MDSRFPAHLEVSALLRQTQSAGGFGMVIAKGEREAGTILLVLTHNGRNTRAYERMPQADGTRRWHLSQTDSGDDPSAFQEYLDRRRRQDPDLWIVELDVAEGERLIGLG